MLSLATFLMFQTITGRKLILSVIKIPIHREKDFLIHYLDIPHIFIFFTTNTKGHWGYFHYEVEKLWAGN